MKIGSWIPDLPDHRDYKFAVSKPAPLPPLIDLSPKMPKIWDQGNTGSCVGHAVAAAFEYSQVRQGLADFMPSRLFIYLNARIMENSVASDVGCMIRDGIKSVDKFGVCSETQWPYVEKDFAKVPGKKVYGDALFHRSVSYARVPRSLIAMKQCLASGTPFCFGISLYESFMSDEVAKTGLAQMPEKGESMVGGHAVLCCGYFDNIKRFWVRNSWSKAWGTAGYFSLPYQYLLDENLSDDLWAINSVGGFQG